MKNLLTKIKSYIVTHKKISIVTLLIILIIGYWGYSKLTSTASDNRYISAKVEKGSIIASISGSGQVSSLNQIDIKTKVSGDVAYVSAKDGQKIAAGGLIAQLDTKDAQKSVRDAEVNLESAQIALEKLKIEKSNENITADLAKAYDDGFSMVSNAFLDLPGIITGLDDMFFKIHPGTSQWTVDWYEGQISISEDRSKAKIYKENFIDSYNQTRKSYEASFENYKNTSRSSNNTIVENLITQTYNTTKLISDSIKNANNYIDFVNDSIKKNNLDSPTIVTTHKATLNGYTLDANTHLVNLLSITTSIKSYKDAFPNADLDLRSVELTVKQKQNALQDAKDKLADYFVRAPFNGSVTKINIKKSDSVSSGTVVTTLITPKQLAEISLNEVDVAKVQIGQKADLTFDAIPDLVLSGVVVDIDAVGTIDQGVVTYIVKINFDAQDERIKPAMSVSAEIITDKKDNVLIVPNSAIKSLKGTSYIEKFNSPLPETTDGMIGTISKIIPTKIPVEVGLTNNSQSEIISGIIKGEEIIIRTITPTAAKAATPSLFGNSTPATRNTSGTKIQAH